MTRRRGVTLIEILIVIAIIGLLIGMLLSSVQRVRESASRLMCSNHLRQIGIALHSYHDRKGVFPPGYHSDVAADTSDLGPGWGWASFLLDDLDQAGLRKRIDFTLDIGDPANADARVIGLAVLVCPSGEEGTFVPAGAAVSVAYANYVGVFGSNEVGDDPGAGNGLFFRNSRIKMVDITDGTSQTLAAGERSRNISRATWTGAVTAANEAPSLILGDTGTLPNSPFADEDDFWSRHREGVNFLFADGSVRAINNSITPSLWNALATRSGGDVE